MANDRLQYIEGTVTAANDRGFKLDTWDEGWVNISQYAKPTPLVPAKGTRVRVGLDSKNYVRSVEPTGEAPPPGSRTAQSASNGAQGIVSTRDGTVGYAMHSGDGERETRIGRMAVLNTATAILSSGGRAADPAAVLALAAQLERWVSRLAGDDGDYARFVQRLGGATDPSAVFGVQAEAEATQAEFFEAATALSFGGNTEICRALGAEPSLGGKPNPYAVRDWVKAGHSWGEGIGKLRAWRKEHPEEA